MTVDVSVGELLRHNAAQFPHHVALMAKRGGAYQDQTWSDLRGRVCRMCKGLIAMGVQRGDRVAIQAPTSLEAIAIDLAIASVGAVSVPIYPSLPADGCVHILNDATVAFAFTEDEEQTAKLFSERSHLPQLQRVVQLSGVVPTHDPWVISTPSFLELATSVTDATLHDAEGRVCAEDDLTIIYTSGTTDKPKGVVLTHAAMLYEARALGQVHTTTPKDVQLLVLPLANAFARVLEFFWLGSRHVLAIAEGPEQLVANLREVRPTLMAGIPRMFQMLRAKAEHEAITAEGVTPEAMESLGQLLDEKERALASHRALSSAHRVRLRWHLLRTLPKFARVLRRLLGGRMRTMISGGSALAPRTAWLFKESRVPLLEGYGLAETSAGTCVMRTDEHVIGSVGRPIPGTHVRIAADGEILVKGPGLMRGYWQRPKATDEVMKDGWFHTGDLGQMDAQGRLFVIDRKSDVIALANGQTVSPRLIESRLVAHPLIDQAVVYGSERQYLTALLTLNPKVARRLAKGLGNRKVSLAALTQRSEIQQAVRTAIEQAKAQGLPHEAIERFHILEHGFSLDTGELTPSLKVKRSLVQARYSDIIEALYATN